MLKQGNDCFAWFGTALPRLAESERRYATPTVRFTGYPPLDQVAAWYRESDLFAFPSVNDGLARVLLEAMWAGLPVLATRTSEAEDCVIGARMARSLRHEMQMRWRKQSSGISKTGKPRRKWAKAARARIEAQFTFSDYEERMIRAYTASTQRLGTR